VVKDDKKGHKTCLYVGVCPQKLKSPIKIQFASKVMLFHETLEFKHVIAFCYEK